MKVKNKYLELHLGTAYGECSEPYFSGEGPIGKKEMLEAYIVLRRLKGYGYKFKWYDNTSCGYIRTAQKAEDLIIF